MLNLKFYGNFNSNFKIVNSKKQSLHFSNFFFFFKIFNSVILKNNVSIKSIKIELKKKKKIGLSFAKADFKYKVSKHLVTRCANSFYLNIVFNVNVEYSAFQILYKYYQYTNILSNVYLNINYISLQNKLNISKKFLI